MENVAGVNTGERGQKSMNRGLEGVKLDKGAIAVGEGETDGEVRRGKLDVWNLMRAEKWEEDRRDIGVEGREEGESGDGMSVEKKQMEDSSKIVGCRRQRKQRDVLQIGVEVSTWS